jgi:Glycosyltransferase
MTLRIAFALNGPMYPDVVGGAEIFTNDLSQELSTRDFEIVFIARKGVKFVDGSINNVYSSAYPNVSVAGFNFIFGQLQILIKLIRLRPELCFAVMFDSALPCWIYAKLFSKQCSIYFAGNDFKILQSSIGSKKVSTSGLVLLRHPVYLMLLRLVKKSSFLVVINKEMYEGLVLLGVKRKSISLIYNFIHDDYFKIKRTTKECIVMFCGRIVYEKGVDILVKSFKHVVNANPDVKLILVGDGAQKKNVEELIKNLGLTSHVRITGLVSRDEVCLYLSQASLFVLPSRSEALGNSLIEAMAAGLPVVATRVGGIPDVVDDGVNGLLVEPDDIMALSEAINFMLNNSEKANQFGQCAHKKALLFKRENIVTQYIKTFNDLKSKSN